MKYYFIGIKGTGMSSLATILNDLGNKIIGYDDYKEHKWTEDELKLRDIKIYNDNSYNLTDEVVIYSAAFTSEHPELKRCIDKKLKILKYNEALGELTKKLKTICVSGCHGKTTTSSMLSHVLINTVGTNFLIGDGTGSANKNSNNFVVEACEYRRHFLAYDPTYSIITNIELDHVDYYKDINDMVDAYQSLINNTKNSAVICGDDEHIKKLNININKLYYGFNNDNDIIATNIKDDNNYSVFDVTIKKDFFGTFYLPFFGKHMILDALAVIGICYLMGIDKKDIITNIKTFSGAKRRFSEKRVNETIIIDDYAHHPTEIKATITSAKEKYKNKRIIALFMPNTYSRVQEFYSEFADALNNADIQYVLEIPKGREKQEDFPNVSSKLILDKLNNGKLITLNDESELLKYKNDVLLFMSCQNIYILEEKLEKLIKETNY